MSTLATTLSEYLQVRRALGYKLEREQRLLPEFVAFLNNHGATHVTTELALRWATAPATASPEWWAKRLTLVRGFAKYARAQDARTEIPSPELVSKRKASRLVPYVYTDDEVRALMQATQMLHGLKARTYATLLGLLAATGMRVGEALALECSDIDWREGVLVVRHSKFGKSRELPLHPTTVQALRDYARQRNQCLPHPRSPSFLLSLAGTRLNYKNVHFSFLRLLRRAGLAGRRPRRPRIHDLRHAFAIKTLVAWHRAGLDVHAHLPSLSTYLGHVCPSNTYSYLTATPELLRLAGKRFEQVLGALP